MSKRGKAAAKLSGDYRKIDFERELDRGRATYNRQVGAWWRDRSEDAPHARAYRNAIEHLARFCKRPPRRIVDYACGGGHVLTRLYQRFPGARLIGIDGSSFMLEQAQRRLGRINRDWKERVKLIETELPDFSLARSQADAVLFVFPNIVPNPDDLDNFDQNGYRDPDDAAVARYLSRAREPDPDEETVVDDPETLCDGLLTDKVISRNLRQLLKRGGVCVRLDYSNARREELTALVRLRMAFEEGSLDRPVNGETADRLFKLVRSTYHRSKVVEDVYHQTKDRTDLEGGYLMTTLIAV